MNKVTLVISPVHLLSVFLGRRLRRGGHRDLLLLRLIQVDARQQEDETQRNEGRELQQSIDLVGLVQQSVGALLAHLELIREHLAADGGRDDVGQIAGILLDDIVEELEDGGRYQAAYGADEHGQQEQ